jgi:cation/acetate symporter
MLHSLGGRDFRDREKLGGRIALVVAIFACAVAFSALLDRIGAPPALVEGVAPYFTLVGFAALGLSLHTLRASFYYAAGRVVPPEYVGFAQAALLAGMILILATEFSARAFLLGPIAGVFAGLAVIGGLLGPLLRKTRAFSISDLLSTRFPGFWTRLGFVGVACVASALVAMAGEISAVQVLTGLLGGQRALAAAMVGLSALLIANPGGLLGTVWTAFGAGVVAVAGLAWTAGRLALSGAPPFADTVGGWREAQARLESFGLSSPSNFGEDLLMTLAVALGIATLAPLLSSAIAAPRAGSSARSALSALGWSFVFVTLITTGVSGAAMSLARQSVGQPPDRLPAPVYTASARGLVTFCGAPAQGPTRAAQACAKEGVGPARPLRPSDIGVRSDSLLTALPRLEQMGAAASGLVAAAQIGLALALAAAGLQGLGGAFGHEAFHRLRGDVELTSRKLATTRLAQAATVVAGAYATVHDLLDAPTLIWLALGCSAAGLAPVLALGLWSRAKGRAALLALGVGLYSYAAALLLQSELRAESAALAALAGATLGLAAGVAAARSRPDGSTGAGSFLGHAHDGDVMGPERGA